MIDPLAIHAAVVEAIKATPVVATWRGSTLTSVEPLTHEETAVLAPAITAAVLSTITEGASAA